MLSNTDQSALSDGSTSVDGRVARITSRDDARALWREYWPDVEFGSSNDDDADSGTV